LVPKVTFFKAVDVAVLEGLRSMRLRKRPIMGPKEADRGTLTHQGWEVGMMEGWHSIFLMDLMMRQKFGLARGK